MRMRCKNRRRYLPLAPSTFEHYDAWVDYRRRNPHLTTAVLIASGIVGIAGIAADPDAVVDAFLAVGVQRKAVLDQMRAALVAGNDAEALRLARQLCGLVVSYETETGNRVN